MIVPTHNQRGVTLLELIVGAAISGIVLGAGLPSLSAALDGGQLQAARRATAAFVRSARSVAVAKNMQARIVVSPGGRSLSTEVLPAGGGWSPRGTPLVLDGVSVTSVTPSASALVFQPQGTAAAVTLTLTASRGGTRTVTLSPLGVVETP